jgi:hypothetical protein
MRSTVAGRQSFAVARGAPRIATSATFDNVRRRSHVCHRVVGEPRPPRLQCILSRCDVKHTFIVVVVRTEVEVNPKPLEQSVQAPGFATIGLW